MAYFHCLIGGGSSGGGYELTVTCDADFAGTTITCTDGVTTLTQTCPSASPYEVIFEIPNGGDWTISGVVGGQTVSTGVSIPTTATLEAIVQKTITIYSAKEDTITYTDIYGDTRTEVFASGQSSKQITIDVEASGSSITFTSGVAKNPSNLSNYYTKTVTINSNTTEIYIMPDNALYWYGYIGTNLESCSNDNGWTGVSGNWKAPTYNSNSITFSPTTTSTPASNNSGVGSKNTIAEVNTVHAIGQRTNSKTYAAAGIMSNKTISLGSNNSVNLSSTLSHVQKTAQTSNAVVVMWEYNGGTSTLYALWYE